jgi:hypothetical protein
MGSFWDLAFEGQTPWLKKELVQFCLQQQALIELLLYYTKYICRQMGPEEANKLGNHPKTLRTVATKTRERTQRCLFIFRGILLDFLTPLGSESPPLWSPTGCASSQTD